MFFSSNKAQIQADQDAAATFGVMGERNSLKLPRRAAFNIRRWLSFNCTIQIAAEGKGRRDPLGNWGYW